MLVAIQGCCHGSLTAIYDSVAQFEQAKGRKADLLLLCGDFQALRSKHDFESLAVPQKFRQLGTFHEYYSGRRVAPVLTIVIGGNHEASNYMWELYHGGWLAPNIYYLGAAGSVMVNGLRISGASGIYKPHDYEKGHFERVPYNNSMLRSVYHIRKYDVAKLMQLDRRNPCIFLSHDWPVTIAKHGNTAKLLQRKPFFRDEVNRDALGSRPLLELLKTLQPSLWFSAHLHVKFAALYQHPPDTSVPAAVVDVAGAVSNPDEIAISDDEDIVEGAVAPAPPQASVENPDEIAISDEEDAVVTTAVPEQQPTSTENPDEITISDEEFDEPIKPPVPPSDPARAPSATLVVDANGVAYGDAVPNATKFLALDKCGKGKDFIQFLDIPTPEPVVPGQLRFTFDPQWLAITRALHPFLSTDIFQPPLPEPEVVKAMVADELLRIEQEGLLVPGQLGEAELADGAVPPLVWEKGSIDIGRVQQFWPTAPPEGEPGGSPSAWYTNPQTEAFCGMLGIENKINPRPQ